MENLIIYIILVYIVFIYKKYIYNGISRNHRLSISDKWQLRKHGSRKLRGSVQKAHSFNCFRQNESLINADGNCPDDSRGVVCYRQIQNNASWTVLIRDFIFLPNREFSLKLTICHKVFSWTFRFFSSNSPFVVLAGSEGLLSGYLFFSNSQVYRPSRKI